MDYDTDDKAAGYDQVQGWWLIFCRWLVLMVADADGG